MRPLLMVLGAFLVLMGAVWTLQGINVLGGSPMSDNTLWAVLGPILAGFGVALVVIGARRRT